MKKRSDVITGTDSCKVSDYDKRIYDHPIDGAEFYSTGVLPTEWGFVDFYRQGNGNSYTSLRFIHDSTLWTRTFNYALSDRFLVTAAKRFAAEIVEADA